MLQTLSIIHQESYSMHDAWCIIHYTLYGTTDIQPEMLSGVQTGNGTPHDKYDIRGIAHARTNRKDDIFMQRRLVQNFTFMLELGQETCLLTKHTWCWIYSALWYFFPACCLVRFAAFLFYAFVYPNPLRVLGRCSYKCRKQLVSSYKF